MRRPTTAEICLASYAIVATFFVVFFHNAFVARAEKMNQLTQLLAIHEMKAGCLGKEIDDFFWLGGCNSPVAAK